MDIKLNTVKDAINLQGVCIELASKIETITEEIECLSPCARNALVRTVEILDFISDDLVPNLSINN